MISFPYHDTDKQRCSAGFPFPTFLTAIMKYRIFNHLFKLQIDKVNKSSLSALDLPRKSQSNDFGTIRNSIYG